MALIDESCKPPHSILVMHLLRQLGSAAPMFLATLAWASVAAAEVCDKVEEGGTWLLPVVLVTGMAALTAFVATRRWAWAVFLVLPIIPSPLLLVDWDIYVYARTEGCGDQMLQAPLVGAAVVAVAAVAGLIVHWIERRRAR